MTDISKEAVDVAANVLRVTNEHYIATLLTALRAALDEAEARAVKMQQPGIVMSKAADKHFASAKAAHKSLMEAEAERDAANALLRFVAEIDNFPTEHTAILTAIQSIRAHLGAKP